MLTFSCVVVALAGVGVLAFMPLPKNYRQRLLQQALGTVLFGAGLAGVIAVVFVKGQIIG